MKCEICDYNETENGSFVCSECQEYADIQNKEDLEYGDFDYSMN